MSPENKLFSTGIFTGVALFIFLAGHEQDFRPENAALSLTTIVVRASYHEKLVADTINFFDLKDSFRVLKKEGHPIALWLGASQLHAIEKPRKGDTLAVDYANRHSEARGSNLVYLQVSSPNASLHDLLAFYLIFRSAGLIPDWLIIAVTYDDLREEGVRNDVLFALPEKVDQKSLSLAGVGIQHLYTERLRVIRQEEESVGPVQRPLIHETLQVHLEKILIRFMEKHWTAYQSHAQVSARISIFVRSFLGRAMEFLSSAKKWVWNALGRTALNRPQPTIETHRVPAHWKDWNMSAFISLARLAKADGVHTLVYKVPHRQDQVFFYHPRGEYDAYFSELKNLCRQEGLHFADFETLVPSEDWVPDGDPFHFRGEGHRRLGTAMDEFMKKITREDQHAL